jgi:hypothetical protein
LFSYPEFFVEEWKAFIEKVHDNKKKKRAPQEPTAANDSNPELKPLDVKLAKTGREKLRVDASTPTIMLSPLANEFRPETKATPIKATPPPPPPPPPGPPPPPVQFADKPKIAGSVTGDTNRNSVATPQMMGFLNDIRGKQVFFY